MIFSLAALGFSCRKSKKLDTRVSLWRLDKIPYGTKYAYDNLSSMFPLAEIRTSSQMPNLTQQDSDNDTSRALIILTPTFYPEPDEMNMLVRFAASGNQVFISARFFADTVLDRLHLKLQSDKEIWSVNGTTDSSNTRAVSYTHLTLPTIYSV